MQQGFSILQTNFPGLNEIIKVAKAHPMAYSAMKKRWGHVVETSIRQAKLKPMRGPVQIHLTWVEKTRRRDPDNIRAGSKFILDALVKAKVLPGDSLATVWGISDSFVVDKEHWRVDVLVTEQDGELWDGRRRDRTTLSGVGLAEGRCAQLSRGPASRRR